MHRMHRNYAWNSRVVPSSNVCNRPTACSVEARLHNNTSALAKVDAKGSIMPVSELRSDRYTYMDEIFIGSQQKHMMWNRDNGIIELMPIAVVYQGESDIF